MSVKEDINKLEDDGYVFFRQFASSEEIDQARQELLAWYEKDRIQREKENITEAHFDGPAGKTILTEPTHLMIDVYGRSPTLDTIVERILTDEKTAPVLKALAGESYDFYGYNIRLMSGSYNPHPAHEFHIDSPGEFGIGILLSDVAEGDDAATLLSKGSHKFPYCLRWNTILQTPCPGFSPKFNRLLQCRLINRLLERRLNKLAHGASGQRGDVYFFINDVWHGRQPNLRGNKNMVMLIGAAPSHVKLHHAVNFPPQALLEHLPPAVKNAYCHRKKTKYPDADIIMRRFLKQRQRAHPFSLFFWAKMERKLFEGICALIEKLVKPAPSGTRVGSWFRKLIRQS